MREKNNEHAPWWHGMFAIERRVTCYLGLVDPELAKSGFFHKWVIYTMEHGESNLQVLLRYKFAQHNPYRS
jgi:hypothetical protein